MSRSTLWLLLFSSFAVQNRTVAAELDRNGVAAAQACLKAIAAGDTATMKDFYADKVKLVAGSELLKKEWGLSSDRSQDLDVERDKLMAAYKKLIARAGVSRWRSLFAQIPPKRILITGVLDADKPVSGVRAGDIRLAVQPRADLDDTLFWYFRRTGTSTWLVVAEVTDF